MEPWSRPFAGRVDELTLDSAQLRGNPPGDPHERPLLVYVPPGYDDTQQRYPAVYALQAHTNQVDMWRNRSAFQPTSLERIDAVFAGGAPPCLVVFVDAWTSFGGSQFLDSPAVGRYHRYLCDEVVPFVDDRYRTMADAGHRGLMGKSSGGYGSMVTAMLRPDLFGGFATHAGDALFEYCYLPEFPLAARALARDYGGSPDAFWAEFHERPFSRPAHAALMNQLAMAACYSADADGTVHLPFEVDSGRVREDVWERWLQHDPVRMVDDHADALRALRAVWIDAGRSDEYYLDVGAGAFHHELGRVGVTGMHFELFDGRHGGIDWRYPLSLAFLAERLQ